jgi:hypothetical protein
MALDGGGFRGFQTSGSAGTVMMGTYFSGTLDANGELSISLANANTYKVEAFFQQDPGAQSGIYRFNQSNTTALYLRADLGALASGFTIAGSYRV